MIAGELDPGPDLDQVRRPVLAGVTVRRVLVGYSVTLVAVGAGAAPVLLGLDAADRCTRTDFGCLGYWLAGWVAGLLLGVSLMLALSLGFRLGAAFWLAATVLLIAPTILSNGAVPALVIVALAPAVAVWIGSPPPVPDGWSRLRWTVRVWLFRVAVLVALAALVPMLLRPLA